MPEETTYARIEDCFDVFPALTEETENSNDLEAAIQSALLDASRLFETETFVPVNFYDKTDGIATDKIFSWNRTNFFQLPPFTEIVTIKDLDDEEIETDFYKINSDTFMVEFRGYPIQCGIGYHDITVNAKWGFTCIPPSVRVAVKNYAALHFLTNPLNRKGIDGGLDEKQEGRLRQTYNRIVVEWQFKTKVWRNLGIA